LESLAEEFVLIMLIRH